MSIKIFSVFHLNKVGFSNFRGDLFGGITAAVIALPLALAFGMASGAGPIAGLYGAICVGLFATLFGGTPSQISGPTGPMTIVCASVFTQFADRPVLAFTVVMMTGGFQILFGYLKLGRYVNLMPYPVISGFLTGVGCILIIMQLDLLLGFPAQQTITNALTALPTELAHPNLQALTLGLLAFGMVILIPKRINRIVPAPLLALIVCTLLALVMTGAPIIGPIKGALPQWQLPTIDFSVLNEMLIFSAVLAALGSIDSLLTSLVADNTTRTFHDSDKELVGQGVGNLMAGIAGGIPGAGATIRTLSNVQAGGRTALSGVIHSLVLLAVVLGLGPLVANVPMAALAGILIKVGIDVIDWRYLKRLHRAPRMDLVLTLVVLFLTIFVNVITAVGVGVILASLVFVKEMAEVQANAIRTISDPDHERLFDPETASRYRLHQDKLMFLHLSGLISFGAANDLVRRFTTMSEYEVLIIDLLDVPYMDGSAALALEQVIDYAKDNDRYVIIVGMTYSVARLLGKLGALNRVRESSLLATRAEAVEAAARYLEQRKKHSQNGD